MHDQLTAHKLKRLIAIGQIQLAGNVPLKIYGTLTCKSGKRMKKENRVFFTDKKEALQAGFRPCGNCSKKEFLAWKSQQETG